MKFVQVLTQGNAKKDSAAICDNENYETACTRKKMSVDQIITSSSKIYDRFVYRMSSILKGPCIVRIFTFYHHLKVFPDITLCADKY